MDEEEIIRCARSDSRYFEPLFEKYYPPIKRYILRRVIDYDVADDIASETFLKALLKLSLFRWQGISFSAWLYRVATNEVNQYFRRKSYAPERFSDTMEFNERVRLPAVLPDEERESWEKELKHHEEYIVVQRIISKLPVKYQEVIALRYFEQKGIKEIAEILGKKEGTVKSLHARGLEKIRRAFDGLQPKRPESIL